MASDGLDRGTFRDGSYWRSALRIAGVTLGLFVALITATGAGILLMGVLG